jgi:hypothetical protein
MADEDLDRRRCPRVPVQITATYRSTNLTIDAQVRNLSQTGLFLECDRVDATGTVAHVELDRPGDDTLVVPSKVVWSDKVMGMGIRFQDMSRELRAALANFILERLYR